MPPDAAHVARIIKETAATEIIPRFKKLAAHEVHAKSGPEDLVTEADLAAERVLTRRLAALLPGSVVVGEEAAHEDHGLVELLRGREPVWVLDPVDGTRNFAHGSTRFGLIVALVVGGETVMGWIFDPIGDDMVLAERGAGSWRDGKRLRLAEHRPSSLSEMVGSIGARAGRAVRDRVKRILRQGSVAHDYLALSRGALHFAYYRRLKPWDHAAGLLIHGEAGGFSGLIRRGQGGAEAYRALPPVPDPRALLIAPDQSVWEVLRKDIESV